jgi:glycosyltransferase involved in cell wall biosynthesis
VIIPAYNAAVTLPACLEAVRSQSGSLGTLVELIVVDDGSNDETAAVACRYSARVLSEAKQGPAAARNLGARNAAGDLVLFTDADCIPASDWVEQLTAPFADLEVVGVKGAYRTWQRRLTARFVQAEYEEKYDRMRGLERIDFVDTYSAAYRKSIFLENSGFDPTFPRASGEDIEFSYRLSEKGYRLVFAPQAIVYHQHPATMMAYFRRKFYVGYWRVRMYRLHPEKMVGDSHTPQSLKLQMGLTLGIIVSALLSPLYPPALALFPFTCVGFVLTVLSFAARNWRKDRGVALVSPFFLFWRALALNAGFFTALVIHSTLGFNSRFGPKP